MAVQESNKVEEEGRNEMQMCGKIMPRLRYINFNYEPAEWGFTEYSIEMPRKVSAAQIEI